MKGAAQASRAVEFQSPTATFVVRFRKRRKDRRGRVLSSTMGRIPRVTRLLVLAHRIDGMIRSGEIRDWAQAARLVGVTRARMSQIANLLLLAPKIQECILNLATVTRGQDSVTEHALRGVATHANWQRQEVSSPEPD